MTNRSAEVDPAEGALVIHLLAHSDTPKKRSATWSSVPIPKE
jgi:hypothetical protein